MPFCGNGACRISRRPKPRPALHPGLPDGARALPIRERDLNGHAIFVAHRPGDMAFAGDVLDQFDAAWPDQDLFATRNLQLAVAAEGDDVLPAGRRVPIDDPTWRCATKLGAGVGEQLITLDSAAGSEFGLDVLYMRLAVRPGIEPVDHQRFVILYGRRFVGAQRRRHLNAKAHQTDAEK